MSAIFSSIHSFLSSYILPTTAGDQQQQPAAQSSSAVNNNNSSSSSSRDNDDGDRELFAQDAAATATRDESSITKKKVESFLAGLKATISECQSSLDDFVAKEEYLVVRIDSHRSLLDEREELLRSLALSTQTHKPDDVNTNNDNLEKNARERQIDALRTKHEADRQSLRDLEEVRNDILSEIQVLRRRIHDLEEKERAIMMKRDDEHHNFSTGDDVDYDEMAAWEELLGE